MTWDPRKHSDDENLRWAWLRAIEWINWPLFISQPVIPLLLYLYPLRGWYFILALFVVDIIWQLALPGRHVSVWIANFGCLFVRLKWIMCPVMAFLLWKQQSLYQAVTALLWPLGVLIMQAIINVPLGAMFRTTDVGPVQNRFMESLGYSRNAE